MKVYRYPESIKRFKGAFPKSWELYAGLEDSCYQEGPLDEKTCRLIKAAVTASAEHERACKVHVQKALEAGATREEVYHALLMLLTSRGFPAVVKALQWAEEVFAEQKGKRGK